MVKYVREVCIPARSRGSARVRFGVDAQKPYGIVKTSR